MAESRSAAEASLNFVPGRRSRPAALLLASLILCGSAIADEPGETEPQPPEAPAAVQEAFQAADRDRDGQVSPAEYTAHRPGPAANRDHRVFDLDASGGLSLAEFWAIPHAGLPRGPLPDPFEAVVDRLLVAIDRAIDWENNETINVARFTESYWRRFENWFTKPTNVEVDPDGNGEISRADIRRFLSVQIGLVRADGQRLRAADGTVVNSMLYQHVDANGSDDLDRKEFVDRSYGGPDAAAEFDRVDTNRDGVVSFAEWSAMPGRSRNDPVTEFLALDTSLDGRVDVKELLAGTPDWKQGFVKHTFPGFDLDRDGQLSLTEYRITMSANMLLPWQAKQTDSNGDGVQTFAEFQFERPLVPLLRYLYFHRLDQNANEKLEPEEWTFPLKTPDEFFVMNADGTGWKSLFQFEGHKSCGSPSVSPDGKQIAFDSNGATGGKAVFLMPIEGGAAQEVAAAWMPTWLSGSKLACSRSGQRSGIWALDLVGNEHIHFGEGWGAQASPDGASIAYVDGVQLRACDVATGKVRTLLAKADHPYEQIFWNAAWSPDGRRICFKATRAPKLQEVAIVDFAGEKPSLKVIVSREAAINADFAWHPNGKRIVFAMFCPERGHTQLYEFNPDTDAPPQLVPGQDETRNNTDVCWTPDGTRLIIVSGDY